MKELLVFAGQIKDIGSTALVVGASIWLLVKYIPSQMRQQGEISEVVRSNTSAIEHCTTVLKAVTTQDKEIRAALDRIEERLDVVSLDVHDIKQTQLRED